MPDDHTKLEARRLFTKAYDLQMKGQLEDAVLVYKQSIELSPTAEAHTFLGWTYSFMGKFEEAIVECKQAIKIDPEFGNPWNDIGAYLIEMGREDEAISFLEKAKEAKRYENPCFAYFNLSRIFIKKGMLQRAALELRGALTSNPDYLAARESLDQIESQIN